MTETQAYPLHWPPWRPRTPDPDRKRAAFNKKSSERQTRGDGSSYYLTRTNSVTLAVACQRLLREISAFTVSGRSWVINPATVIVSSNVPVRRDGLPYSNAREPDDPGVAVYFEMKGQKHCLTCDKWDRVADNLNAIAKHIEAMRGQLRWGVADVAAMFAGFKALPGAIITPVTMSSDEATRWIEEKTGVKIINTDSWKQAYRMAAKRYHDDSNAGKSMPEWTTLQEVKGVLDRVYGL